MYDKGPKLGVRRKRKARETMLKLEKALEELSTKLKVWGAAVHGKVRQLVPPYNCQATRHAKCYVNSLCKRCCACKILWIHCHLVLHVVCDMCK